MNPQQRPRPSSSRRRRSARRGALLLPLIVLGFGLAGAGLAMGSCSRGDDGKNPVGAGGPATAATPAPTVARAPAEIAIPGWTVARTSARPASVLRGYGELTGSSAVWNPAPGREASYLRLIAADLAHAALTLAKYRSDLGVLGGIDQTTMAVGGRPFAVANVAGQGRILAVTAGREVLILAAQDAGDLERLANTVVAPLGATATANSDAVFPAWLDTYDRHGFRFYYRPWERPKDVKEADYDVAAEFDFTRAQDTGLVFWAAPSEVDPHAGGNNRSWWEFAQRAQVRRGQPWVLNTSATAPTWLLNRNPADIQQVMPGFSGGSHGVAQAWCGSSRALSWSAQAGKDEQMAGIRDLVQIWRGDPLLLDYLEPHGELKHGEHDIFLEFGPQADQTYRDFLRSRYGSVAAVAKRWEMPLAGWDEVRVPEVADFLGWEAQAIDLAGSWRIAYEPDAPAGEAPAKGPKPVRAPPEWSADVADDSAWPQVVMPGNDLVMYLPHKPAVLRRSVEVPAAWLAQGKAWLYLWDLNTGEHQRDSMSVHLNGRQIANDLLQHAQPHWGAYEVGDVLRAGANNLALRLPQGILGYRAYLSHQPPVHYPRLGRAMNARWVDFSDWRTATRVDAVRRGMEAIRSADPDRSIINMSPDSYTAQIKELCEDYGGRFHNTGHMGGFWNDFLPMMMRSSGLPFTLEPGGPAKDLAGFRFMMGLYLTEGVNAVHYFIHVGDVLWDKAIRDEFIRLRPVLGTIGKVHAPKAEAAILISDRAAQIGGFPWKSSLEERLPGGYWSWRFSDVLGASRHIDALSDRDFARGNADAYRVIIDTNTTVMDEALVDAIEAWVRKGGTFVTWAQTGRHGPETPDSWPIARLTGYRVTGIDAHAPDGHGAHTRKIRILDDTIWSAANWPAEREHHANGLSLEKVAPECRDLVRWQDGPVAAGLRPLGRGMVVHLGMKFSGAGGGGGNEARWLGELLDWAKVPGLGAQAKNAMVRHSVANNGLWEQWTVFNHDQKRTVETALRFERNPGRCRDLLDQSETVLRSDSAGAVIDGVKLGPCETRSWLTPRGRIADAALAWFDLQRSWWRASAVPQRVPQTYDYRDRVLELEDGWAYKPLPEADATDLATLTGPDCDDAAWPRRRLGPWLVPEDLPSRRAVLRRTFTVPAEWGAGRTTLWLRSWFHTSMVGRGRLWLDGREVTQGDGRGGLILDLERGGRHVLALEIRGEASLCGPRAEAFLAHMPDPAGRLDLAGAWTSSPDLLHVGTPVTLPGKFRGVRLLGRSIEVPAAWRDRQMWISLRHSGGCNELLVNGHMVRRHHHNLGPVTELNLTPWLRPGAANRIELLTPDDNVTIDRIELQLR